MEGIIITFLILIMFFCAAGRTTETFRACFNGTWDETLGRCVCEPGYGPYDCSQPEFRGRDTFAGLPSLAGPPYGNINAPGFSPAQCQSYGGVFNEDGTCTMGIAKYGNLSEWGTPFYQ